MKELQQMAELYLASLRIHTEKYVSSGAACYRRNAGKGLTVAAAVFIPVGRVRVKEEEQPDKL